MKLFLAWVNHSATLNCPQWFVRRSSVLAWRSAAVSERPAAALDSTGSLFIGKALRLVLRTQLRSVSASKLLRRPPGNSDDGVERRLGLPVAVEQQGIAIAPPGIGVGEAPERD